MSTVAAFLLVVVLVAGGVASGVLLSTVVGIVPFMLASDYRRYVQTVQFLRPRFDPLMPATNGLTVLGDAGLVIVAPQWPARILFAAAAVLVAGTMLVSIVKQVPVNRYVVGLDPQREPDDWPARDPRRRWRNWNVIRTSFAVVALALNASGAALLS
ncbi:MAG TPA: DUF1772 domain-containing protein [Rugosimonospora sp.]|nr:DUF1772 domain-containing protein [Rugosimonospora sp.]